MTRNGTRDVDLPDGAGGAVHARYLALVDRCLLDRRISRHESDRLAGSAAALGIDRATAVALNRRVFDAVVGVARQRGAVTAGVRADLAAVAALLRIEPAAFEAAIAPAPGAGPRASG